MQEEERVINIQKGGGNKNEEKLAWILNQLPEERKPSAKAILESLLKNGDHFEINKVDGQIAYNGEKATGGHIVKLLLIATSPTPV